MAIPNGFAHPMLSLGVITSLGLLKPDNLGDYIKLYPDLFKDYYIVSKEAQGYIKKTDNTFFDQWVNGNKPFENFKVTGAATGGSPGAAVTVTLTQASHIGALKELSPAVVGHFFVDDTTGIEYEARAINKGTNNAHTITLAPTDNTETAAITTSSVFLWKGRQSANEASTQLDGMYKDWTKRRRELSIIRTDKNYTDLAMMEKLEYQNRSYYDLDKSDMNDRHLYSTEDQLMLGRKRNNLQATGTRNSDSMGLVEQIREWGEDLGSAVTVGDAFWKSMARAADADGYTKKYDALVQSEFWYATEDWLDTKLTSGSKTVVINTDGKSDLKVNFDYSSFKIYGMELDFKTYALFNTARTHGSDATNSYLEGQAVFIPQGNVFINNEAGSLPMFRVRYMSMDGEGWINKVMTDGGLFDKNTKANGEVSIVSYKGLETYNIHAFKIAKLA